MKIRTEKQYNRALKKFDKLVNEITEYEEKAFPEVNVGFFGGASIEPDKLLNHLAKTGHLEKDKL